MIFANWDLFKRDNWMQIDGRMVRADLGGALDRRAQGDLKSATDWGPDVKEFASMREKEANKNPYKLLNDHELADSVRTLVANLSIEAIEAAFEAAGFDIEDKAAASFATLTARMSTASAWADAKYPLDSTVHTTPLVNPAPLLPSQEPDEEVDPWDLLVESGFTVSELARSLDADDLRLMFSALISSTSTFDEHGVGHGSMSLLSWPDLITPPEYERSDATRDRPPMTGPEELLQDDQFSPEVRSKMPKWFSRMQSGRLVRRMSDAERDKWIQSANSQDVDAIAALLFGDKRGEMVLSVNDPYIFDRERAALAGESYTATEDDAKHPPEDYRWVLEIPITEKMLQFLRDYAYINTPAEGKKITSFSGNPAVKTEGAAGGRQGSGGIPNVVIKQLGLGEFWSGIHSFTFVLADEHLWKHRSSNKELVAAQVKKQREEAKAKAKREREEKEAAATDSDDEDVINWSLFQASLVPGDLVLIEHLRGQWKVVAIEKIVGAKATLKLGPLRWDEPFADLVAAPEGKSLGDTFPTG
jgi:hypothetical protein